MVKQDVRLLNEHVIRATLTEPLRALVQKHNLASQKIDWFLPHYSSKYFAEPVAAGVAEAGLNIARADWFTNLTEKGTPAPLRPTSCWTNCSVPAVSGRATSC